MRHSMKFFIFFLMLWIQAGIYAHGFIAGTLVKTDAGYTKIQEITCGEYLVSYDLEHGLTRNQVKAVLQKNSQELICIKTDTAELMVDAQQLLYAYDRLEWVSAHLLKCGDRLLSARYGPITIRSLEEYTESETVHCCSFERIHTFCVSSDEIVVHNFTIGIDLLVWPTIGKIITVGCLALGSYLLERTAAKKGIQLNIAINSQSATFWHVSDSMGFKTNSSFSDLSKSSAHPLPSDLVHGTPARSPVPLEQAGCRPIKQEPIIVVTEFDSINQTKPTVDATPAAMIQEPAIECFPIPQQETLINSNESDVIKELGKGAIGAKPTRTFDDILKECKPGRETKGRTKQFEKSGTFEDAMKDFESLQPTNIKIIDDGKAGDLENGFRIIVQTAFKRGQATLELQYPTKQNRMKIRYGK